MSGLYDQPTADFSQATAMAVASTSNSSSLRTNLKPQICLTKPTPPSQLFLRQIYGYPARPYRSKPPNSSGFSIRAYMEESNSLSGFANKVVGSLPVFGLIARILSNEGGVGGDVIDFAEFRRRVGNNCSVMDSKAFYEFQDRRGRAGDPLYVLLCCWLAAVGAGLLKSEEILEGVARLRISNDIEFEEENFLALMNEAREKRAKLKVSAPKIPMEIRVEKALEAIYICCFGKDTIGEEDETLLSTMLKAVFPSVEQTALQKIVKDKAMKVAEGGDEDNVSIPMPLSKEAVQLQMKDLQFLQQQSDV